MTIARTLETNRRIGTVAHGTPSEVADNRARAEVAIRFALRWMALTGERARSTGALDRRLRELAVGLVGGPVPIGWVTPARQRVQDAGGVEIDRSGCRVREAALDGLLGTSSGPELLTEEPGGLQHGVGVRQGGDEDPQKGPELARWPLEADLQVEGAAAVGIVGLEESTDR